MGETSTLIVVVVILFLLLVAGTSESTPQILVDVEDETSIIQGEPELTFNKRGAFVMLSNFHPDYDYYVPNRWEAIDDLNINYVTFNGGGEGYPFDFHMLRDPSGWASNLETLLTQMNANGVQTSFIALGSIWDEFFGIQYPAINIAAAKAMIDQLAGDNSLGHDFITDPRIWCWIVDDEIDLDDAGLTSWCLDLCDYIRGKGGKAAIAYPRVGSLGWESGTRSQVVEPILRGHVDYLIYHAYYTDQYMDDPTFDTWYAFQHDKFTDYLSGIEDFLPTDVFINAWGIWSGSGSGSGYTGVVTETQQHTYYRATMAAARDAGIVNIAFYYLFESFNQGSYHLVAVNDVQLPAYSVVKSFYVDEVTPPEPPIPPPPAQYFDVSLLTASGGSTVPSAGSYHLLVDQIFSASAHSMDDYEFTRWLLNGANYVTASSVAIVGVEDALYVLQPVFTASPGSPEAPTPESPAPVLPQPATAIGDSALFGRLLFQLTQTQPQSFKEVLHLLTKTRMT